MKKLFCALLLPLFILSCAYADTFSVENEEPKEIPNSNIHGYFETVFKNDYITPRGLLVNRLETGTSRLGCSTII